MQQIMITQSVQMKVFCPLLLPRSAHPLQSLLEFCHGSFYTCWMIHGSVDSAVTALLQCLGGWFEYSLGLWCAIYYYWDEWLWLSRSLSLFLSLDLSPPDSACAPAAVPRHILLSLLHDWECVFRRVQVRHFYFPLSACTCGYWVSDLAGTVSCPHVTSINLVPGDRREGEGFVEYTATIGLFSLIGMTVSFNHPGSLLAPPFEYHVCLFVCFICCSSVCIQVGSLWWTYSLWL